MNLKGSVPIDLDRRRQLRFDENAMAELADATGKNFMDLMRTAEGGDWYAIRAVVWAGLLADDPSLLKQPKEGMRRVGEWMSRAAGESMGERLAYFVERLGAAFRSAFGELITENPTQGAAGSPLANGTHSLPSSSQPVASGSLAGSS